MVGSLCGDRAVLSKGKSEGWSPADRAGADAAHPFSPAVVSLERSCRGGRHLAASVPLFGSKRPWIDCRPRILSQGRLLGGPVRSGAYFDRAGGLHLIPARGRARGGPVRSMLSAPGPFPHGHAIYRPLPPDHCGIRRPVSAVGRRSGRYGAGRCAPELHATSAVGGGVLPRVRLRGRDFGYRRHQDRGRRDRAVRFACRPSAPQRRAPKAGRSGFGHSRGRTPSGADRSGQSEILFYPARGSFGHTDRMNSSRSALMSSAWVVGTPWGRPGYD